MPKRKWEGGEGLGARTMAKEKVGVRLGGAEAEADPDVDEDDDDLDDELGGPGKNSLDSDEEDGAAGGPGDDDEEEDDSGDDDAAATAKYDLHADYEGEEEGVPRMEGEVLMTPFNLREEMEEGKFDADGNFVWKDKRDLVRDGWLDQLDQMGVAKKGKEEEEDSSESEGEPEEGEVEQMYREMLTLMKEEESVAQALRRLGGRGRAARGRGRGQPRPDDADKEKMLQLTGLADSVLTRTGNMDIYQETYEAIAFKVRREEKKSEPAADMFSDDFVTQDAAKKSDNDAAGTSESGSSSSKLQEWEIRKGGPDPPNPVTGPFSTSQMIEWSQSGEWGKEGVWVRKVGTQGAFYHSRRIDFELYE